MCKSRALIGNGVGGTASVITLSSLGAVDAASSVTVGYIVGIGMSERKKDLYVCEAAIALNLGFTALGTGSRSDDYSLRVAVRCLIYLAVTVTALVPVGILVELNVLLAVVVIVGGGHNLSLNVTAVTFVCHLTLSSTGRSHGNLALTKAVLCHCLYGLTYGADLPVIVIIGGPTGGEGVAELRNGLSLGVTALTGVGNLTLGGTGCYLGNNALAELVLSLVFLSAALTFAPVISIVILIVALAILVTEEAEEGLILNLVLVYLTVYSKSYDVLLITLIVTRGKGNLIAHMEIFIGESVLVSTVLTNELNGTVTVLSVVGVTVGNLIAVPLEPDLVIVIQGSGIIVNVGVGASFVFTVVSGVTAVATGGSGNGCSHIVIELCKGLGIACITSLSLTYVVLSTGIHTGCNNLTVKHVVVVERIDCNGVGVVTGTTGIGGRACYGTGCGNGFLAVAVTVRLVLLGSILAGEAATYTELENVSVLGTGGIYVSEAGAMAVKITSLLGSKSGYGIAGEVIGLEGNVACVVGSLDSLYLALIVDEPDRNTVYVLALGKLVGESDGDIVVLEVGDESVFTLDGEVVNRIVTDLSKLFLVKSEIILLIFGELVGGYGDLLITDKILNSGIKLEVGIIAYLKLVVEVGAGYLVTGGDHLNGLGLTAMDTGVGDNAVSGNTTVPSVTESGIDLNSLLLSRTTAVTGESLNTLIGTGCGSGNSCSPVSVADNGLGLNYLATVLTCVLVSELTGLAGYDFNIRSNAGNIVTELIANLLISLLTASRTSVVVNTLSGTGRGSIAYKHTVVTGCGSKLHSTGGTYLIGSTGSSSAGSMSVCGNILGLGLTASTASGLYTAGKTGCGSSDSVIAEAMTGRIDALGLSSVTVLTGIGLYA